MKITADNYIINQIKEAIETSSIGVALQEKYTIIISNDLIEFILKPNQIQNIQDFFWLGWISNEYQ